MNNGDEMRLVLTTAFLHFRGLTTAQIAQQLGIEISRVEEFLVTSRRFVELRCVVPGDRTLEAELIDRFGLADAVVVETAVEDRELPGIGEAAAKYFVTNVTNGSGVALSCGETLLEMLKALPSRPDLRLGIAQLSVEGDPENIHQSPAALVGLLRAKASPESTVLGVQLLPAELFGEELRQSFTQSGVFRRMRENAASCRFLFVGIGVPDVVESRKTHSYFRLARKVLSGEQFADYIGRLNLVGELNNQLYDGAGRDRTADIPELSGSFVNILTLEELRQMSERADRFRVVAVAAGRHKATAIRTALQAKLVNVLITSRDTARHVLGGGGRVSTTPPSD